MKKASLIEQYQHHLLDDEAVTKNSEHRWKALFSELGDIWSWQRAVDERDIRIQALLDRGSGIPQQYRAHCWYWFSGARAKELSAPLGYYSRLLEQVLSSHAGAARIQIERDLDR